MRDCREELGVAVEADWRACSACPGDYEDPDRTARTASEIDEDAEADTDFERDEEL